jgi:hypothetical protein
MHVYQSAAGSSTVSGGKGETSHGSEAERWVLLAKMAMANGLLALPMQAGGDAGEVLIRTLSTSASSSEATSELYEETRTRQSGLRVPRTFSAANLRRPVLCNP